MAAITERSENDTDYLGKICNTFRTLEETKHIKRFETLKDFRETESI
jgi:hypothetical protein